MKTLKRFGKYILFIIIIYIITFLLTFIGFNVNYSQISSIGDIPEQISIEKAEATSSNCRIYGYISNNEDNNVNGKYIKIIVYNNENNLNDENELVLATEYIKISDVTYGESKLFKAYFNVDNVVAYSIDIVDDE